MGPPDAVGARPAAVVHAVADADLGDEPARSAVSIEDGRTAVVHTEESPGEHRRREASRAIPADTPRPRPS